MMLKFDFFCCSASISILILTLVRKIFCELRMPSGVLKFVKLNYSTTTGRWSIKREYWFSQGGMLPNNTFNTNGGFSIHPESAQWRGQKWKASWDISGGETENWA